MSTASKFILINATLVNMFFPSAAIAFAMTEQSAEVALHETLPLQEIAFDPKDGGRCEDKNKCAAGGAI